MSPLGPQHSCNPPRHTFNQILTYLLWYLLPFHFTTLPKSMLTRRWDFILVKPVFEVIPKMFDRAEVWRLRWPLHNSESTLVKPLRSPCTLVFRVVILLKDHIGGGFVVIFHRLLKFVLQDGSVELCIHLSFNPGCISNTFPHHTAPHHHISTPKFHCALHKPIIQFLSNILIHPHPPI